MKKIIVIISVLLCSQSTFAQLEKGMKSIGLSSGVTYSKNTNEMTATTPNGTEFTLNNIERKTRYTITPTLNYFISSKFSIGLSLGYNGTSNIKDSPNYSPNYIINNHTKNTSGGITISPFVKYYIPLSNQVFFFFKGGIGTNFNNGKTSGYTDKIILDAFGNSIHTTRTADYGPDKTNTFSTSIGINPGILFMPTKKIGIELYTGNLIGYNYRIDKTKYADGSNTTKSTQSGFEFLNFNTLNVGTGIYYFF
jgi:hypothetical protein